MSSEGSPRRDFEVLVFALPITLGSMVALNASSAPTLPISLFWLSLASALGLAAGRAAERRWPAPLLAWIGAGTVCSALLWPAVLGGWDPVVTPATFSFGSTLSFTSLDQALERTVPVPAEWRSRGVVLRVDLSRQYGGDGQLRAEVNGVEVGRLSASSGGRDFEAPGDAPAWGLLVPSEVIETAPHARIVLRPTLVDPAMTIAIHPDRRITPPVLQPSRFFDGKTWHADLLAGPHMPAQGGAYRVWLLAA